MERKGLTVHNSYILAIDQGTTNSRAHLFTQKGDLAFTHEMALSYYYPKPGWVEQDPEEMWLNTLECCRQVIKKSRIEVAQIAAISHLD